MWRVNRSSKMSLNEGRRVTTTVTTVEHFQPSLFFPTSLLWPPLLSQSTAVMRKCVTNGQEKKTELGTLWHMVQISLLRTVVLPMNVGHRTRSTRSITLVALAEVILALVPGLVGQQSTGRNKSRCLGLLTSSVSFQPRTRMRSCMGKEHE